MLRDLGLDLLLDILPAPLHAIDTAGYGRAVGLDGPTGSKSTTRIQRRCAGSMGLSASRHERVAPNNVSVPASTKQFNGKLSGPQKELSPLLFLKPGTPRPSMSGLFRPSKRVADPADPVSSGSSAESVGVAPAAAAQQPVPALAGPAAAGPSTAPSAAAPAAAEDAEAVRQRIRAFVRALKAGDLAKVVELLEAGVSLERRDAFENTPLILACH